MGATAAVTVRGSGVSIPTLVKRVASAVVGVPVFLWVVMRGPTWLFQALVVAIAALAAWELGRMLERAGRPAPGALGIVTVVVVTCGFLVPGGAALAFTVAVAAALSAPVWLRSFAVAPDVERMALTTLALTYIGWLLGHALWLHAIPDGAVLVVFVVALTWVGESAAYFVGSALGRHRLAPTLSPGKTVEGGAAQLVLSVIAGVLLGRWLLPDWSILSLAGAGALLGVVGQIGDLAESAIKRSLGTKDTGGLIPGHGGILDRIDGLLFNLPAFFYFVTYVGGLA